MYLSSYSARRTAGRVPSGFRLSSENVDEGGNETPSADLRNETPGTPAPDSIIAFASPAPPGPGAACTNTAGDATSAGILRWASPIAPNSIAASTSPRPRTSPTFAPPKPKPAFNPPPASSYRNRLDPAYPQSSAANAANATRFAGVAFASPGAPPAPAARSPFA